MILSVFVLTMTRKYIKMKIEFGAKHWREMCIKLRNLSRVERLEPSCQIKT